MTLAKCVGTEMDGGLPITSYDWHQSDSRQGLTTLHLPSGCFAGMYKGTLLLGRPRMSDPREDIDILKIGRQSSAEVFQIGPIFRQPRQCPDSQCLLKPSPTCGAILDK